MSRLRSFVKKNIDVVGIALLMFAVFSYIMFAVYDNSDLIAHARIAQKMLLENVLFSNNFLMYFMANLLTLFSGALIPIAWALVLLISASNTAKYVLVKKSFYGCCGSKCARIASFALLFVYIVPVFYFLKLFGIFLNTNTMYLGYSVPNVWHNSTILCMMPFAIAVYQLSVEQFEKGYEGRRNGWISIFVIIATLIKPSFFFVYAVAFPVVMFGKYRQRKEFFWSLIPILCGCVCVLYEYITIYTAPSSSQINPANAGGVAIEIMPLFTLGFWQDKLPKLMISLAFPLLFVLSYWKSIIKEREFWFVFVMLVVAFGISWCCKETGPRAAHGNFGWQVVSSMWFVFYYMLKTILKDDIVLSTESKHKELTIRGKVFVSLFVVHVAIGVYYLLRFLVVKNFG